MRILIVTVSLPHPPASGGAIRVEGIVRGLHQAGHSVTLICYGATENVQTPLADICEQIITVPPPQRTRMDRLRTLLLTNRADIAERFYSDAFQDALFSLLEQTSFDLIQFEAIESACFMRAVRAAYPAANIVFDTFNAEAELQRTIATIDRAEPRRWPAALYSWMQSRRITRYEGELCRLADAVIAVSDEDCALLSRYRDDDRTFVVPSGIFVKRYQAVSSDTVTLPAKALVFTGKMDYRPNVDAMLWFANAILPRLSDATLVIVGQKPHPRLQTLATHDNIVVTGWVDSVLPYLQAAIVYVAPLRMGSGTRLKILEAMASSCAIVATSLAASGLDEQVRAAMHLADTEEAFATAIQKLLDDPSQRQQLGQLATTRVAESYDWSVLIPRLLQVYEEVLRG